MEVIYRYKEKCIGKLIEAFIFLVENKNKQNTKMMDVEEAGGGGQEVGTVQWGLVPLWSRKMGFSFNALAIGPLFDSDRANIIFGTVKGKIRIYVNDKVRLRLQLSCAS
jgi:hypothetical protein